MNLFTKIAREVFLFGAIVVLLTLPWAKSLSSFGIGIALGIGFVYSLVNFKEWKKEDFGYLFLFGSLYLIGVISYFYSENKDEASAKLFLKLPLLLLPFCLPLMRLLGKTRVNIIMITFVGVIFLNAVVSTIHYFLNYELLNELALHAKPIPIIGKIYHIQFSVFNALSIFLSVHLYYVFKEKKWASIFLFLAWANFITLHILAARTGLFAFYFCVGTYALYYSIRNKSIKGFVAIGAMVISLVCAFYLSTSFRNRVHDTKKDLLTYYKGTYPNHYSNTQRIMAFKTASTILGNNLVKGVGIGDVHSAMLEQYAVDDSPLLMETRKKPHNQFLENALQSGVLAIFLLLGIFIFPLFYKKKTTITLLFLFLFFISMQFESLLERQASLYVFLLFYALLVGREKHKAIH